MVGTAGLILAGGRSSRMGGGDKTMLTLGAAPLLRIIIDRLEPQVEMAAISSNHDPDSLAIFSLPVLADVIPGFEGPLAGILTGLEWAASLAAPRLVTVAGDTPFFPADLAQKLNDAAPANGIAVAASERGPHPVFASWPTALARALRSHLESGGTRKIIAFMETYPHVSVTFAGISLPGGEVDPFYNINTPDDLAEARRLLHDTTS